jgi:hypothetical protein
MALTVKPGKTPLVFEYDDGVVSSSIKILPEDDEAVIVAKLKRVIALVEGAGNLASAFGPDGVMQSVQKALGRPVAAEPPQLGPEQVQNGWEMLSADDLEDAPGEAG